jgi:LysM repeat protein
MSVGARYGVVFGILAVLGVIAQFIVHSVRTDPRDTRTIAERELRLNTLRPGEKVERMVSVFQRRGIDYFRATRGLLVVTNERILFLGLRPRDLLAPPDAPPTFEERVLPLDTLVEVRGGRSMLGVARAVVIDTPDEKIRLGVPSRAWPEAKQIIQTFEARHAAEKKEGVRQLALRKQSDERHKATIAQLKRPKHYTVRRGDALGSVATMWNTTPEKLQEWNRLPDNRIRVGQTLLVRPGES